VIAVVVVEFGQHGEIAVVIEEPNPQPPAVAAVVEHHGQIEVVMEEATPHPLEMAAAVEQKRG